MITVENIDGKKVKIEWVFDEVIDRHDSNWCEWTVKGTDDNGNEYSGACQADGNNPESIRDDNVTDVEKLNG